MNPTVGVLAFVLACMFILALCLIIWHDSSWRWFKEQMMDAALFIFLGLCALGWVIMWIGIPGLIFLGLCKFVFGWPT